MKNVCLSCQGTGMLIGNGMIMRDCHYCEGVGQFEVPDEDELNYLEIKQTERFADAKAELKKEFPEMSDKDADELMTNAIKKKKKK